jgi:hypothetical protein
VHVQSLAPQSPLKLNFATGALPPPRSGRSAVNPHQSLPRLALTW